MKTSLTQKPVKDRESRQKQDLYDDFEELPEYNNTLTARMLKCDALKELQAKLIEDAGKEKEDHSDDFEEIFLRGERGEKESTDY